MALTSAEVNSVPSDQHHPLPEIEGIGLEVRGDLPSHRQAGDHFKVPSSEGQVEANSPTSARRCRGWRWWATLSSRSGREAHEPPRSMSPRTWQLGSSALIRNGCSPAGAGVATTIFSTIFSTTTVWPGTSTVFTTSSVTTTVSPGTSTSLTTSLCNASRLGPSPL